MKAILFNRYGSPADLALGDLARPQPRDGEVLVRVRAKLGERPEGRQMKRVEARTTPADLEFLRGLLAAGTLVPIIDRTYPLEEVPAAIAYQEEGHSLGKVVIRVPHAEPA